MYTKPIRTVYFIMLFNIIEFQYSFKHSHIVNTVFAANITVHRTDWVTLSYDKQAENITADIDKETPVSELKSTGEENIAKDDIFARRTNSDTTYVTQSTGRSSSVSATNIPIPYQAFNIQNATFSTENRVSCNKKLTRSCHRKKKNKKVILKPSETIASVTTDLNIPRQEENGTKETDHSLESTTDLELQSPETNTKLNACNDSAIITTPRGQNSVPGGRESNRGSVACADNATNITVSESQKNTTKTTTLESQKNTTKTTTSESQKNTTKTTTSESQKNTTKAKTSESLITSSNASTIYSATSGDAISTPGTTLNVANSEEPPKTNHDKKAPLSLCKKKAKKCQPSTPQLRMTIKSKNATLFYPGYIEQNHFHRGNQIILEDPAFKEARTYFLLKSDGSLGNAYADSVDNCETLQTIQCVVDGLTNDVVYMGWHRWNYSSSLKTSELTCEANSITSGYDTHSVIYQTTKYPMWFGSVQGEPEVKYMLGLQPSVTGLYVCIAVDARFNVLLTGYLDIRILTVVTLKNASITPQEVQIYTDDTQASFIFNHCRGYFAPKSAENLRTATAVYFFNLDNSVAENVSFTVSYLQKQLWSRTERLFENLNLNSPMLLRCDFTFTSDSNIYESSLQLYFRHKSAKNRVQKAFTAVINETLNFSCKGLFFRAPVVANASYFEGECSENKPAFTNSDWSNITLTVSKPLCLVCSSYSSQIKLQINTENDYRTQIQAINLTNENSDCLPIWCIPAKLATVNGSSNCEETAVALLKDAAQNQSKIITFQPSTYKVYYTTRQLIVCQNQPISWSNIDVQLEGTPTSNEDQFLLKVIAGILSSILALLMLLVWMKKFKGKQQAQDVTLDSIQMHDFPIHRQSNEKVDLYDELDFANPGEHVEQSRILLGPLLGSGKFGRVFKAYLKSNRLPNTDGVLEVAAKEIKANSDIGRVNKEIQIMRMIVPHLNIIGYYGYSLGAESNLLIMELAIGPCLLEYLREQRITVPGFVLRMHYQNDCRDIKHELVSHKMSSSSYSNVAYSHDSFQLQSNNVSPKNNSTHNRTHAVYSNNEDLETVDNNQIDPSNFMDCDSVSSAPDHDQWSLEYEDSNTERSVEENTEQHSPEWSRRSSVATESMSKEIFSICRQVARGMAHISSLNIIHRDLAARNIVLASCAYPLVVKICDFGMAHNFPAGEIVYKENSFGPRPFRWMSPEALNKGEFTVYSDVWSYGVMCWEVITLGSYPFGKMPNFAAAAKVAAGHHLPRPSNCESEIYAILKSCWKIKPPDRPSFESLEDRWSGILEANSDYIELQACELGDCE